MANLCLHTTQSVHAFFVKSLHTYQSLHPFVVKMR
jgi:hypothetical protein